MRDKGFTRSLICRVGHDGGRLGRVVAEMDMVTSLSDSSNIRAMVDLPAPEGDDSTIRRPRRWRLPVEETGSAGSMTVLASVKPFASSDGMVQCTKKPLKCCDAPYIVQCNKLEIE